MPSTPDPEVELLAKAKRGDLDSESARQALIAAHKEKIRTKAEVYVKSDDLINELAEAARAALSQEIDKVPPHHPEKLWDFARLEVSKAMENTLVEAVKSGKVGAADLQSFAGWVLRKHDDRMRQAPGRKLTVPELAKALGLSEAAVKQAIAAMMIIVIPLDPLIRRVMKMTDHPLNCLYQTRRLKESCLGKSRWTNYIICSVGSGKKERVRLS